ncbi:MAG: hypothetical protein LAO56_10930 [Acidobacteriia bacterium]|nr:hypothetical protein [Terriglobia bacterium]
MKHLRLSRHFCVVALTLLATFVHAQTYTELHNFDWHKEGANPLYPALLAQGQDGSLYGTLQTQLSGVGSVFNSTLSGAVTQLYGFTGNDGEFPQSGLSLGFDGNFYGTTEEGGALRKGTVFKITPGGSMSVLHEFTDGADGAYPWAAPIQAPDGNIYGVTDNGTNQGRIYRITSSGTFSVIAIAPAETQAPLILGTDGNLYGTTPYGGTFNQGTVFQLTTKGKLKIIHNFGADGLHPFGPVVQAADGKLYGTTPWGGTNGLGTVYVMTMAGGGYKVLHNFTTLDGVNPSSGMVQGSDKFLYSVATSGGANGVGSLFKINTSGTTFSVLYNFNKTAGGFTPTGTPTLHTNGTIYGATNTGGSQFPAYGVLYSFTNKLKPFASLVVIWSGKVGTQVGILGQGFSSATGVKFGSGAGTFTAVSDTYMIATVAAGATTGNVTVLEPGGNLVTPQVFKVIPSISGFSPTSGTVGTSVVITGMSLAQTTAVTFGGVKAASFTVNSDTQVTAVVPTGGKTGTIKITTKGGSATSAAKFTVN